jgi:hypothetical protein
MQVILDQTEYIEGQPIYAWIVIRNDGPDTLLAAWHPTQCSHLQVLDEHDHDTYSKEDPRGVVDYTMPQPRRLPPAASQGWVAPIHWYYGVRIDPTSDIARFWHVLEPGRYTVTVDLRACLAESGPRFAALTGMSSFRVRSRAAGELAIQERLLAAIDAAFSQVQRSRSADSALAVLTNLAAEPDFGPYRAFVLLDVFASLNGAASAWSAWSSRNQADIDSLRTAELRRFSAPSPLAARYVEALPLGLLRRAPMEGLDPSLQPLILERRNELGLGP